MKDIVELLKEPGVTIAIIGANNHPAKYGNVIYRDLKRKGYAIYPVNPTTDLVEGDKAYPELSALPVRPTIVDFVTPPPVTLSVLKQCLAAGLKNVWLQPGSENPDVMRFVQENGFNYLAQACIMVETRY